MENAIKSQNRIVATYTTIPGRYEELERSILSLMKQTIPIDCIYVTLPIRAARLNKEYPTIPDSLGKLCTIVRTKIDYGPITKLYGALVNEKDPNTIIISCDDDVIFAPNHIEIMMKHHKEYPKDAICGTGALLGKGLLFISIVSTVHPFKYWSGFTGFDIDERGRKVDLIFGVAGVLYTRSMFPSSKRLESELFTHSLNDNSIFHNDDVLISGYLSKKSIDRRVFYDIPTIEHIGGQDALSGDIFKMIFRLNESIEKVKNIGYFPTMEEISVEETPAGRVFIALAIIILIIVMCIYLPIKV